MNIIKLLKKKKKESKVKYLTLKNRDRDKDISICVKEDTIFVLEGEYHNFIETIKYTELYSKIQNNLVKIRKL